MSNVKNWVAENAPAPELGGQLITKDFPIAYTDAGGVLQGASGNTADGTGIYISHTLTGTYDPTEGGAFMSSGKLELNGTNVLISKLASTDHVQVYATPDGDLYGVEPPISGWDDSATSTANFELATRDQWYQITGLSCTVQQDILTGDRYDTTAHIFVAESGGKDEDVVISYGINGAAPTGVGKSTRVIKDTATAIPVSTSVIAASDISAGQTVEVWVKKTKDNASTLFIDGPSGTHTETLSVPSGGSGVIDLTDSTFPTYAVFQNVFAASAAIDFANGNKQALDVTGLSLTFAAPGPGSFILDMVNSDALTAITTPVLWDSGTVPTWAGRSVLALFYDGTNWFGSALVGAT